MQNTVFKRLFDILFSLCVLLFGAPVFLVLILLVKCSSKGPVLYGSTRVGMHKKKIVCWKFRTMYKDADLMLKKILEDETKLREWEASFKLKKDCRVTKLGRFLRKTSLDELPQFWNVLKGDLSVVGPRPVSKKESLLFLQEKGEIIFSVRPGITGLWQTLGRNDISYNERMDLEEKYVKTRSFKLDLILIAKTIPLMISPKGAF